MAVYKKKFENVYEKNLTSEIDGIETVDVTEDTTLTYAKGLHIDANGKVFNRKAKYIDFTSPKHTVKYDTSYSESYLQIGAAALNYQMNLINTARSFTWKTETSTSYNLAGGLFLNPSPIKVKRTKIEKRDHPNATDIQLLSIEMANVQKVSASKASMFLKRLHVWGF